MKADLDAGANAINVAVEGDNNNIHVSVFPEHALDGMREKLANEFSGGNYTVLLCAPNDGSSDAPALILKNSIKARLRDKGISVVIGGGEEALSVGEEAAYDHLQEASFVEQEKCNSIVFIACDSSTFSQLSLLTHIRHDRNIKSIDIVVIPKDEILSAEKFLAEGVVKFSDDLGGKVYMMSQMDGDGLEAVIERIHNRKILWTQASRKRGG